jgi:glycosyltransferase involved in cell wall biosynthesis
MSFDIEIVFPVLNEQNRLTNGVEKTYLYCKENKINACLTIADNGSSDRTMAIAKELQKTVLNLKIISVGERGVGRALKAAWLTPRAPIVGYMDVDLATDLKHLNELAELFKIPEVSVVSGSRLMNGSVVENRTLVRGFTSRCFNLILKARLGVGFSDGMCGFKFIRADLFRKIHDELSPLSDAWFFNTEFLVKSEWLGHQVSEIAVHWRDDGDSRVEMVNVAKNYLAEIKRLVIEKKLRPKE